MGKPRAPFVLLTETSSSEQVQQALTCKVGDAEKHHLDDGVDSEASLHRLKSKLDAVDARQLMARFNFKLLKLPQITEQRCVQPHASVTSRISATMQAASRCGEPSSKRQDPCRQDLADGAAHHWLWLGTGSFAEYGSKLADAFGCRRQERQSCVTADVQTSKRPSRLRGLLLMREAATALRFPGNRAFVLQSQFAPALIIVHARRSRVVCVALMLSHQLRLCTSTIIAQTQSHDLNISNQLVERARLPTADRTSVLDLTAL